MTTGTEESHRPVATEKSARQDACFKQVLAPFEQARTSSAMWQVATSLLPYIALMVISYLTLGTSIVLTVALVFPMAGFLVRTFVVFHDCAHGSLLPSRKANGRVGAVLGMFVLSPFVQWRHEHAIHHATSGDLDRRGIGDVLTLTVSEYYAKPWHERAAYRLFRNPLVMFGVGPIFALIVVPRVNGLGGRSRMRRSVLLTDAVLAVAVGLAGTLLGWDAFLEVWAPGAMLGGSAGIWLFYVQHQFEDAYWQSGDNWDYADAALQGSTYLKLPRILQFFTANIGLHHVHHLNAKIPNYNLQRAHESDPAFSQVPTIGIADGMRAIRFKLWDERSGKLVTFTQARRSLARTPAAPASVAGAEA